MPGATLLLPTGQLAGLAETEELTHHAVHTSELMVAVALEANTSAEEGPKSSKIQTLDPEFTS